MGEKNGSMREKMPHMAAFIDEMRKALGKEHVDNMIRRGMRGEPGCFYAEENGHQIGTRTFKLGSDQTGGYGNASS